MSGIGEIRIGMKEAEVKKLTGQAFTLKHFNTKGDESYNDTARLTWKGIDMDVVFQRSYSDEKKFFITVSEVRSSSPVLKTKSGIGIGDDKLKIITTYEGYLMHIAPEYEADLSTKSKTRSTVWLFGDSTGNVIIFYLTNNKITGFSVIVYEGC